LSEIGADQIQESKSQSSAFIEFSIPDSFEWPVFGNQMRCSVS